jgi:hypothetical protein
MSTSEILDRTFSLYRNNFLLFAGIALLPGAVALLLHLTGVATHLTVPAAGRPRAETQLLWVTYEALVIFVTSTVGWGIASGATLYAVYHLHLGRPATIASSYRNVLASGIRVILAAVLVFLAVLAITGAGLLAVIFGVFWPLSQLVPTPTNRELLLIGLVGLGCIVLLGLLWLYVTAWLSFVIPALLLDRTSIFRSFRRSHFLAKKTKGRLLLTLLLTVVLTYAFTWAMRIPAYMLLNQRRQAVPLEIWADVCQFLSSVIAGPIAAIAIALFYIDERIRKEAFDLQVMMESIQQDAETAGVQSANPA